MVECTVSLFTCCCCCMNLRSYVCFISIRYSAFADLFCDAIKSGLPALQTQHPGLYFHKSAEYLGKRKEAYQQCCAQSSGQILDGNQLSNIFWSDFFGVRGTKLSEPMNEQQMIIMVQETEKNFNHSVSWASTIFFFCLNEFTELSNLGGYNYVVE